MRIVILVGWYGHLLRHLKPDDDYRLGRQRRTTRKREKYKFYLLSTQFHKCNGMVWPCLPTKYFFLLKGAVHIVRFYRMN